MRNEMKKNPVKNKVEFGLSDQLKLQSGVRICFVRSGRLLGEVISLNKVDIFAIEVS